ncbi:MAG: hypothetical protein ACYCTE_14405 [Acidimicrobiales bacterium]
MNGKLKRGTEWSLTWAHCTRAAPEVLETGGIRNLVDGDWRANGKARDHATPVDGSVIEGPPLISHDGVVEAVAAAVRQHAASSAVDLDERRSRVSAVLDAGDLLVQAVTVGREAAEERLYGNFRSCSLYPTG